MKTFDRVPSRLALAAWSCAAYFCLASDALAAPADAFTIQLTDPVTIADHFSTNVAQVIQLAESGVEEEIILAYIEASQGPFELSGEDIVYLKDLGIPTPIIIAMLRKDTVLREQRLQPAAVSTATNQFTYDQRLYPPQTNVPATMLPPPVYVTNAPPQVTYFYGTLQPYGTWIEIADLGWCWQPRVIAINRDWRPYWQNGSWVYSDLGWYWHSDYSWVGPHSIMAVGTASALRLGLVPGSCLGSGLGLLALFRCALRLGAAAARSAFRRRPRLPVQRYQRGCQLRFRPATRPVYVCRNPTPARAPPTSARPSGCECEGGLQSHDRYQQLWRRPK